MATHSVVVGLSGGVDSAVTAHRLIEIGYEVIGVTLLMAYGDPKQSDRMRSEATALAASLGIAHEVVESSDRFRACVIMPFISAWTEGETPNPCVLCNPTVKFARLFEVADRLGADYVATGHYATLAYADGSDRPVVQPDPKRTVVLCRATDRKKDQSYFLHRLPQAYLRRTLFPLGEMTKADVRAYAAEHRLAVAQKRDSQEICFLPDGKRVEFLKAHDALGEPGPFLDTDGRVIGEHGGLGRYTVGQRRRLGQAFGKRMTVIAIDPARNAVILGDESDCLCHALDVSDVVWQSIAENRFGATDRFSCQVQLRSQGTALPCDVTITGPRTARVRPEGPTRMASPGQFAVFYDEAAVLGGGKIERLIRTNETV